MPGAVGSGLGQQLLDDYFRLLVLALAEVMVPEPPPVVPPNDGSSPSTGSRIEDVCSPAGARQRAFMAMPPGRPPGQARHYAPSGTVSTPEIVIAFPRP
jgi:hypothetical protein